MKWLALIFIVTLFIHFFLKDSQEIGKAFPRPPKGSLKDFSSRKKNISLYIKKKPAPSSVTINSKSRPKGEVDSYAKRPSLLELLSRMDEVNKAKKFVLNFKFPKAEVYNKEYFDDGTIYTALETKDSSRIYLYEYPDGSSNSQQFSSNKMELMKSHFENGVLGSFYHSDKASNQFIAVSYGKLGKINTWRQKIGDLIFKQNFDEEGTPYNREVVDPQTYESISFDYYFREIHNKLKH